MLHCLAKGPESCSSSCSSSRRRFQGLASGFALWTTKKSFTTWASLDSDTSSATPRSRVHRNECVNAKTPRVSPPRVLLRGLPFKTLHYANLMSSIITRLVTESAFVPMENCLRQLCPLFSLPIMLEFIPALMRTLWLLPRLFTIPFSNIPSAKLEVKRSQLVPRPLTQPNCSFNLYFLISWAS